MLDSYVEPIKAVVGNPGDRLSNEQRFKVGKLLIEAKKLCEHGKWGQWLDENFELSDRTARGWMKYATDHELDTDFISAAPPIWAPSLPKPDPVPPVQWTPDPKIERINANLRAAFAQAAKESAEQNRLRPKMIEIVNLGYAQAARKAHPDVGGSTEQMDDLNKCKEFLLKIAGGM
jgi:Protein of unknown function (DUF3102)